MMKKIVIRAIFVIICTVLLLPTPQTVAQTSSFFEDWTGSDPTTPLRFRDSPTGTRWDISTHSRDGVGGGGSGDYSALESPINAQHHSDCAAPPLTHGIQAYEDVSFVCKQHLMTSIYGSGAAVTVLTPNHLVDLSQGEATIRFDISTSRTTGRDYWEIDVTPWENHQQLVQGNIVADLNGPPKNSFRISTQIFDSVTEQALGGIEAYQINNNFDHVPINLVWNPDNTTPYSPGWMNYDYILYKNGLSQSQTRRDTFEIKFTPNHITLCMPDYPNVPCIINSDFSIPLTWNKALVQFSHHSYNTTKNCNTSQSWCQPNTWHWDEIYISPSVPFTIMKATERWYHAGSNTPMQINFTNPAPPNSKLRFTGLATGNSMQVSYNNGASWHTATIQPMQTNNDSSFRPYFTGDASNGGFVPAGITSVLIKGTKQWWTDVQVRDVSFFSQETPFPDPSPSLLPSVTPTSSTVPSITPAPLIGDLDQDLDVDLTDYTILISTAVFGSQGGPADLDTNGIVNIMDLNILVTNFTQ